MISLAGDMPRSRLWRAYWVDTQYEFIRMLRSPIVFVPLLVVPVGMYTFIGIILSHTMVLPVPLKTAQTGAFVGWMTFAIMGPAMMSFGLGVAAERQSGVLTYKRALPMPPFAFVLSKLVSAVFFGCVVIAAMSLVTALFSEADLSARQYVNLFFASSLMVLPFCSLGLVFGVSVPVAGAMLLANIGWIGLSMMGGLLFPVPRSLSMWVPTYYASQLSRGLAGLSTQTPVWLSVTVLAAMTVILGALAANRINAMRDV